MKSFVQVFIGALIVVILILLFFLVNPVGAQNEERLCRAVIALRTIDKGYTQIVSAAIDVNTERGYTNTHLLLEAVTDELRSDLRNTDLRLMPEVRLLLLRHLIFWETVDELILWALAYGDSPLPEALDQQATGVAEAYTAAWRGMVVANGCAYSWDDLEVGPHVADFIERNILPQIEFEDAPS